METINIRGHEINHEEVQSSFWAAVKYHSWEEHTFDVLDKHIKPGTIFIDIGAWNGVLSLYAASLGASCYAIEPDDKAFAYLSENVELNPQFKNKISLINAGISDRHGFAELKSANGDWGNSMSSLLDQGEESKGTQQIRTVELSQFIEKTGIELKDVSLIKIDIEGWECKVLPQARNFLSTHRPNVYLSLHPFWFPDFKKNTEEISDIIFSLYQVLLNGEREITQIEFVAEMEKMDGVDVLLKLRKEKVGLVIPVYNRPEYLDRCMASLSKLTIKPYQTIYVDDASTDISTISLLNECVGSNVVRHNENTGVKGAIKTGCMIAFDRYNCDIVIVLDADAIVKPEFIDKLVSTHNSHNNIVSGFNCLSERNPIIYSEDGLVFKNHCNGINMCFSKSQYEKYILPTMPITGNWDYNTSLACQADGVPFIITTPSLVQHIGKISSMGHAGMDIAADFKPLSLKSITLFGIDAHDPDGINRAAEICQQNIEFGDVKIITERIFPGHSLQEGRENFSKFMIKDLDKYIQTSHALIIHADGYIINWTGWDDEFLKYDYIGATWGYKDNKNVGNGGFSLRSKKLINILASDNDIIEFHPEDDKICRLYRSYLEQGYGIKFAPEEVANRFSIEAYASASFDSGGKKGNLYSGQFGFHSMHVDFSNAEEFNINPLNLYKKI